MKNQTRKTHSVLLFLSLILFCSCSRDKKLVDPGYLEITPSEILFDVKGGSQAIIVDTDNRINERVKLEVIMPAQTDDWCKVLINSGGFFIQIDNAAQEVLPPQGRTAIVVVRLGHLKEEVIVTQR